MKEERKNVKAGRRCRRMRKTETVRKKKEEEEGNMEKRKRVGR
jgi:hypothetical protein